MPDDTPTLPDERPAGPPEDGALVPGEPDAVVVRNVVLEPVEEEAVVSRRVAFAVIGAAIVLLIAAVALVPHFRTGAKASSSQPQLATASVRSFPVTLAASGTVVPNSETSLNFPSSGQVSEIDVTIGQRVAAGTVLAKITNPGPAADLGRAQAAVAAAAAALEAAQAPLDPGRASQLQSAVSAAQSGLTQAQATATATASSDAAAVAADRQQLAADQAQGAQDGCAADAPSNALVCQSIQSAITGDQGRLQVDQARQASDATTDQARISQAQAQVSLATAALQAAGTPSASQVASAQAGVTAANAELSAAQAEVAGLVLTAPANGTILQINGQVGESVTGAPTANQTLPGTTAPIPAIASTGVTSQPAATPTNLPFIVLGDSGTWVIGAAFPATESKELHAGLAGTITGTTLSGLSMHCHVLAVAPASTVLNGQPVVYVSLVPDGDTSKLTSGLAVNAELDLSQASGVLAVPQSAVYILGGVPHVDVWNGTHAVATVVTTGVQGTDLVQITSGLSSGQQVVLSAYQGLPQ